MALANNYSRFTTANAGTILSPAPCVLHTVVINTGAAQTLTLYDGTSTAGTIIAVLTNTATVLPDTMVYDVQCRVGLFAVSTGTGDITVSFG